MAERLQPIGPDGPRSRVIVAGATGYAGALAAQLVWNHPALELAEITSRSETGTRLNDLYPRYDVTLELKELDLAGLDDVDVGIVAYPHGAAAPVVAEMRGLGMTVVDLSADFRLDSLPTYERYYGPHGDPDLLEGAVYGLTELERAAVAEADLVANPGCYPTASILALAPLAEAGLIEDVVIDAKSGVSGAGRGGGEATGFTHVTENVFPYKPVGHRHRPEILEKLNKLVPAGGSGPIDSLTFVPHLVPVDQGELVSCYVKTAAELGQGDLDRLYADRYEAEPFVTIRNSPPGMRDVRETNQCHIQALAGDDRILVFAAIDNLWKGSSAQAIQNLNLMLGLDEGLGDLMSDFFRSRWVTAPEGVEQLDDSNLPDGFRAGGVPCGLKGDGKTDLGIVVCDEETMTSSILLTKNAAAAAPIRVCRDHLEQGSVRAAIVNSGNANAATGEQGMADALSMRNEAATALGLVPEQVAVAETGVIGVPMDMDSVLSGIGGLAAGVRADGAIEFSDAIMTTDKWPKRFTVTTGGVTLSAQAKGAGMIEPGFATMLCFVQTDAVVEDPETALRAAVDASFERITVDGQMSTNDTVLLQASGRSGKPLPAGLLDAVLLQLALEIVRDGEGATRVGRIEVTGAGDEDEAELVARRIANSPLVKTALLGRDPNWGRIAQAAGAALAGSDIGELGPDVIEARELAGEQAEAELALRLDRGQGSARVYFSDLTHEYIVINAEYTT